MQGVSLHALAVHPLRQPACIVGVGDPVAAGQDDACDIDAGVLHGFGYGQEVVIDGCQGVLRGTDEQHRAALERGCDAAQVMFRLLVDEGGHQPVGTALQCELQRGVANRRACSPACTFMAPACARWHPKTRGQGTNSHAPASLLTFANLWGNSGVNDNPAAGRWPDRRGDANGEGKNGRAGGIVGARRLQRR